MRRASGITGGSTQPLMYDGLAGKSGCSPARPNYAARLSIGMEKFRVLAHISTPPMTGRGEGCHTEPQPLSRVDLADNNQTIEVL